MHRFGCAGIINSDDRNATEIASLEGSGVYTLAVSEVENLLLLPTIFELIAQALNFSAADARTKASELSVEILQIAQADLDHFALEYTRRRIDRTLKVVGLKSKDIASLDAEFKKEVGAIDPSRIFSDARKRVQDLISAKDGRGVLASYSNKGLIASAAKYVGLKGRKELEEFVGRTLRSDAGNRSPGCARSRAPERCPSLTVSAIGSPIRVSLGHLEDDEPTPRRECKGLVPSAS